MPPGPPWTSTRVAEQLVAAFRRLPDHPVMRRGPRVVDGEGAEVEPLGWPERFLEDPHRRRVVLTWARCTAVGASVSERYRDLGWPRSSAERHRAAALQSIARGLNAGHGQRRLDSGTECAGASLTGR